VITASACLALPALGYYRRATPPSTRLAGVVRPFHRLAARQSDGMTPTPPVVVFNSP